MMDRRERQALDRWITGNYGEDQLRECEEDEMENTCKQCGLVHDDPRERCTMHYCLGCGKEMYNTEHKYCNYCVDSIIDTLELIPNSLSQVYYLYLQNDHDALIIDRIFVYLYGKSFKDLLCKNILNERLKKMAVAWWSIEDVEQLAAFHNIKLTEKEMATFLENISSEICDAMMERGWSVIEDRFETFFEDRIQKEGEESES